MNREDIIRMAREAGMDTLNGWRDDNTVSEYYEAWPEQLERFFQTAYVAGAAAEREACAKVVEDFDFEFQDDSAGTLQGAAEAIRSRGQA